MNLGILVAICLCNGLINFLYLKIEKIAVTYASVAFQFAAYVGLYFLGATLVQLLIAVMFAVASHFAIETVINKYDGKLEPTGSIEVTETIEVTEIDEVTANEKDGEV